MLRRQASQSLKELVRHVALKIGYGNFLDYRREKLGVKTTHLRKATVESRFQSIYATGAWVNTDSQKALSGLGSELSATSNIRQLLPSVVSALQVTSIVDVGCGDWTWMKELNLPCHYLGVDVVSEVILSNSKHTSNNVAFMQLNAISEPLPNADAALCREVLFHLSFEDSLKVLNNIKNTSKFLIATTNDLWFNSDIRTGDFRNINLCRPPYSFPSPLLTICDDGVSQGRVIGVWRTSSILVV